MLLSFCHQKVREYSVNTNRTESGQKITSIRICDSIYLLSHLSTRIYWNKYFSFFFFFVKLLCNTTAADVRILYRIHRFKNCDFIFSLLSLYRKKISLTFITERCFFLDYLTCFYYMIYIYLLKNCINI